MEPADKIKQLEAILEDDPSDHLGWFMLGKLYLDEKRFEDGAEAFHKCLGLKPDYSAAYRFCGDCHRLAENRDEARSIYEKGVEVANANGDLQTVKEMEAFLRKL